MYFDCVFRLAGSPIAKCIVENCIPLKGKLQTTSCNCSIMESAWLRNSLGVIAKYEVSVVGDVKHFSLEDICKGGRLKWHIGRNVRFGRCEWQM